MEKGKVGPPFEHAGVVQRTAVVELVKGDDVVGGGVCQDEVPDEPGSDEAFATGYEDVFDIG